MAFIIVEGPTAAGKSTLIKRLVKELGDEVQLVHKDRPKKHTRRWVLGDYVLDHQGYRPGTGENVVADRWHWGEVTYAPLYRPDTNVDGFGLLGAAGWRWTEMFLASRGAVVAYLTADNETLAARLEERGDDHVTNLDDLFRISSLYEAARRDSNTMGASFNTSVSEMEESRYETFVESLLETARQREVEAAKITAEWPQYLGSLHPQVLLVGDRRNVTEKHGDETQLTFLPAEGNSGEVLLRSLPDMFWRSVGMVNGNEVEDVEALWTALGKPRVVALGAKAEGGLLQRDFTRSEFATLPHPQYVRRFHHAKINEYGKAIQRAAETGKADGEWRT